MPGAETSLLPPLRVFRVVESVSAHLRLAEASAFLLDRPADSSVTIVAASRGAADELVRRVARARGATLGLERLSLSQAAARAAASVLAARAQVPTTVLGAEAVAARAAFEVMQRDGLRYLAPVAGLPGFPRALSRTLEAVRGVGLASGALEPVEPAGADLARLLARADAELAAAGALPRAGFFEVAAESVDETWSCPLLLLDVPITTPSEERFVTALTARASHVCATLPGRDEPSRLALERAGGVREVLDESGEGDLPSLRRHLFAETAPKPRALDGTLTFLSAPGEGREAVEIARRVLQEAGRGVPFDEMAILVRRPQQYQGLLEHALERAGVPAWFDRGTRRPHPAGRAVLALLGCAVDGLSARRFAEYLSLGQVPAAGARPSTWEPSPDEVLGGGTLARALGAEDEVPGGTGEDLSPASAGTLRAPHRWEHLLVEAAVIGGGVARWRRRLDGLEAEFSARLREARRDDPDSGLARWLDGELEALGHLRGFALPLIDELAGWADPATWGDWLDRLGAIAPRVLRRPASVERVLADLRPMAAVGPVPLAEVRDVLSERLLTVTADPPPRRYGRVFVGSPDQARGRTFRVVFVPGLAERMFPQKAREDPLLTDAARRQLDGGLATRAEGSLQERLLLHLAAGAATERLHVSYPRLEVLEARPRVPSFYALDVMRGATGEIPDHQALAEAAADAGGATLAWPSPRVPASAIDDQEHDLAVLRGLLDTRDPAAVRGRAQYLLRMNPAVRRSVTERWARADRKQWTQFDGLVRVTGGTRAALAASRLGARPYSLSALQRFAVCPYQFLLAAIYRLRPADRPDPLQRLDPLTRGSLVHEVQAKLLGALRDDDQLPVTAASRAAALGRLDEVLTRVAGAYREDLAPAIERVWRDEIASVARDLRVWVDTLVRDGAHWTPRYFELAFGLLPDPGRDPASAPDPVRIDGRFTLRGAIDLVEEAHSGASLRVTDHKTGRNRAATGQVLGGGRVLQPVLYALAVEAMTGRPVRESRLSFCTVAGDFSEAVVPMDEVARRAGIEALEIVDRAIEAGHLARAPAEGACTNCDFRSVCGPSEEDRVRRKPSGHLRDLAELRSRP